jgi:membrane-bound lytic murein transglycosylase A
MRPILEVLRCLIVGGAIAWQNGILLAQQGTTADRSVPAQGPSLQVERDAPTSIARQAGRWIAARWDDLPGFAEDSLSEAWNAWVLGCGRAPPVFLALCDEVRRLSIGSAQEQREWMVRRLQPFRVETAQGGTEGLLTGYFEPVLDAARRRGGAFGVPLYRPPADLSRTEPWFSRMEIDRSPQAKAALQGLELAWLADPIDALILHIQGSGRLRIANPDGSLQMVRVSYAGSNNHPYRSIGKWLLDQGAVREASWGAIKAWALQNPQRVNEMLWSNPRAVFFSEEAIGSIDTARGPKGAQGVELTPGRSIAVDRDSIPYGTPVWMVSVGPAATIRKLVLAQDTGSAIVGAVRADYFAGWGAPAEELAGRLRQGLRLWVLWPKGAPPP